MIPVTFALKFMMLNLRKIAVVIRSCNKITTVVILLYGCYSITVHRIFGSPLWMD